MRAFVLTDTALTRHAGRFVWLSIDTENRRNAATRAALQIRALPSYFVLDPATERVAARWIGSMSVPALVAWLEAGERAVRGERGDAALAIADSLAGAGREAEAADAYRALLEARPASWPARARVLESLAITLGISGQHEACAALASRELPALRGHPASATLAAAGLDAALALPADHAARAEWAASFERAAREIVADTTLAVAADDRSGVWGSIVSAREAAGDSLGHLAAARGWAAFLDGAAARARTPHERTVFDSHRLSAALELGDPARAIPMLEASERDFPDDYNPPARLSIALRELRRWDEATAASDRALARAYGPRRLLILRQRADLHVARGDVAGAREALEQAIAYGEAMPEGQRSATTLAALRRRLDGLR